VVGAAGGDRIVVSGIGAGVDLPLDAVTAAWRGTLPALLGHGTTQG
jgi:hypothetical protein